MSLPRIENINRHPLSESERDVLKRLFVKSTRLAIKAEFGGGFGGCRVFLVRPMDAQRAQLPTVVKLGPTSLIQEEYAAFVHVAQHRVPKAAPIEADPVLAADGRCAGIRYQLAGQGRNQTDSLRQFANTQSTNHTADVLNKLLFPNISTMWQDNKVTHEFYVAPSFDPVLPVNLRIKATNEAADTKTITPETFHLQSYQPHDSVKIQDFVVTEIDQTKAELTLDLPGFNGVPGGFRLRVTAVDNLNQFQPRQRLQQPLTGLITETRQTYLQDQLDTLFNEVSETTLSLPELALPLPNPIAALPKFLHQSRDVRISDIHGDLNLENVLVEYDELPRNVSLIDFARARQDYALHDLLRLETGFWLYLVPDEMQRHGRGLHHLPALLESINTGKSDNVGLEKAHTILTAVRQAAQPLLFNTNDWQEYSESLIIYLLGALKFKNLNELPTHPLPKQTAVVIAAALLHLLNDGPTFLETAPSAEPAGFGIGSPVEQTPTLERSKPHPMEKKPMKKFTADQLKQVRQLLQDCADIYSSRQMRAYFEDPRLEIWQNRVPIQSENQAELIRDVTNFLSKKHLASGENALVLFLQVVNEDNDERELCHQQIATLVANLQSSTPSPARQNAPPTATAVPEDVQHILFEILSTRFNMSEIKELCFRMNVDFEDLSGSGKKDKVRELIMFADRHGRMMDLIRTGQSYRPDIKNWPGYGSGGGGTRLPQKPAVLLHAQAGLLNVVLRQMADKWQVEVHNIGITFLQRVSLILIPSTAVAISPGHLMFDSLQPGETIRADDALHIQVEADTQAQNQTCPLDFEVIYQTPGKSEKQLGRFIIPTS